jgi:hypothetical protein
MSWKVSLGPSSAYILWRKGQSGCKHSCPLEETPPAPFPLAQEHPMTLQGQDGTATLCEPNPNSSSLTIHPHPQSPPSCHYQLCNQRAREKGMEQVGDKERDSGLSLGWVFKPRKPNFGHPPGTKLIRLPKVSGLEPIGRWLVMRLF